MVGSWTGLGLGLGLGFGLGQVTNPLKIGAVPAFLVVADKGYGRRRGLGARR